MNTLPRYLTLVLIFFLREHGVCQPVIDKRCNVIKTQGVEQFENWLNTNKYSFKRSFELLKVPVVVHVIHEGEPAGEGANISYQQVVSQIRILNEDFRRKEGTKGFNDHSSGSDSGIEFVLARSSPDGKPTDGIVRIDASQMEPPPFGGSMILFGAYYSIWDPSRYLNIWAIPGAQDLALGEARFPEADLPGLEESSEFFIPGIDSLSGFPVKEVDGVAINSIHFGEVDINSVYNLGRTGTHEVGHFLGLFHVWGPKGVDNSCGFDDFCSDTPNTAGRTTGCPSNTLACDGSVAMVENYMDYSDDVCMNIFTADQVYRMRTVLENSPRRKSLLTSNGLQFPEEVLNVSKETSGMPDIYPNPFDRYLYIEFSNGQKRTRLETQFYDLSGAMLGPGTLVKEDPSQVMIRPPEKGMGSFLLLKVILDNQIFICKVIRRL